MPGRSPPASAASVRGTEEVRTKVAWGWLSVSMMAERNCRSRRSSSLTTVAMSTTNSAESSPAAETVNRPSTLLVRPTPSVLWPKRISATRYPTTESVVVTHSPGTTVVSPTEPVSTVVEERLRRSGASSRTRLMYTQGPPTTSNAAVSPPARRMRMRVMRGSSSCEQPRQTVGDGDAVAFRDSEVDGHEPALSVGSDESIPCRV